MSIRIRFAKWIAPGLIEKAAVYDLLKDPAAVRVNYLRGTIACQNLIDEAVAPYIAVLRSIASQRTPFANATVNRMADMAEAAVKRENA